MIEREKIINAIENCYILGHNCTECPLFQEDDCIDKLMHDALAMLKGGMIKPIYSVGRELILKLPARVTGYSETEDDVAVDVSVSIGKIRTMVALRPEELEKYVVCAVHAESSIADQEQKTVQKDTSGYWIVLENCSNAGVYCSECHTKIFEHYPIKKKFSYFCPHCGTRMEEQVVKWE